MPPAIPVTETTMPRINRQPSAGDGGALAGLAVASPWERPPGSSADCGERRRRARGRGLRRSRGWWTPCSAARWFVGRRAADELRQGLASDEFHDIEELEALLFDLGVDLDDRPV